MWKCHFQVKVQWTKEVFFFRTDFSYILIFIQATVQEQTLCKKQNLKLSSNGDTIPVGNFWIQLQGAKILNMIKEDIHALELALYLFTILMRTLHN